MSTSFFQYQYCTLCRVNHKQRRKKHIYSKRHQIVLKNVLSKFSKKITEARAVMEKPVVRPLGWECGAGVWCYFCQTDVTKHQTRDTCIVASATFVTHLASADHLKKMHEFFWDNMIPVDKKESFTVTSSDVTSFMEKAEKAVNDFEKKERDKLSAEASKIRVAEEHRRDVAWQGRQQELGKSSHTITSSAGSSVTCDLRPQAGEETSLGKKTVFAFGPGLTCLTPAQGAGESEGGNIYTGATPPWLLDGEGETGGGEIGPTAETYSKHLYRLQKQKLPVGRVGASFDHKVDTSQQWLPDFGRVWNNGRRLNSRSQFQRETSSKERTSTTKRTTNISSSSLPFNRLHPYSTQSSRHQHSTQQSDNLSYPLTAVDMDPGPSGVESYNRPHTVTREMFSDDVTSTNNRIHTGLPQNYSSHVNITGNQSHTHMALPENHSDNVDSAICVTNSNYHTHTVLPENTSTIQHTHTLTPNSYSDDAMGPNYLKHPPTLDRYSYNDVNPSTVAHRSSSTHSLNKSSGDINLGTQQIVFSQAMHEGECRPYKRRRVATSQMQTLTTSRIPIMPSLLAPPEQKKHSSKPA